MSLTIDIPSQIYEAPGTWDGEKRVKKLIRVPAIHLVLEHSLLSISKWESEWQIPFVETKRMTAKQFLSYCKCMTINQQKDPNVYQFLRNQDVVKIKDYLDNPMTARIKRKSKGGGRSRIMMTSEYFYAVMVQYGIPFDCDKWHFNRLIALIECCQAMNGEGPKMNYRERQKYYAELNAQRRKALGTKG